MLRPVLDKSEKNLQYFIKILSLILKFFQIFCEKFGLFFIFEDLAFLKLLMAKVGLFIFCWTWQPWLKAKHDTQSEMIIY